MILSYEGRLLLGSEAAIITVLDRLQSWTEKERNINKKSNDDDDSDDYDYEEFRGESVHPSTPPNFLNDREGARVIKNQFPPKNSK